MKSSTHGSPEVALKAGEVYHLPLQPVSHYRRRQLDHLNDWLPREKLYTMPRSLKPQGSRALGRLAFADNYLRIVGRFRREVQQATHPDALYQSVSNTGLALRDATPRVYVIAAAGGGVSGCLTDLGFALRRLLKQMHHPEAPVTALVFCGAPDDPATPPAEQANIYATLTELNHFADPCVPFAAQYGVDGPRLVDEGSAFDSVYILPHANRTPESRRDALAHLGSYLFHELTTPLGLRLDHCRLKRPAADAVCFRSLGTYGIWFPRGLLLRLAARRVCQRLLEQWQAPVKEDLLLGEEGALLEAAQARVLADPELQPEGLPRRIAEAAAVPGEGEPAEILTRLVAGIEEQSRQMIALEDPAAWATQALSRVREWLGSGIPAPGAPTVQQRKSRMTKALETGAAQLAEKWDRRFTEVAYGLLDHSGRRLALAEAALARFVGYCDDAAAAHAERLQQQAPRSPAGGATAASRPGELRDRRRLQLVRQPLAPAAAPLRGPPRRLRPPVHGRRHRRRDGPVLRLPARPAQRPPARPDLLPAASAPHARRCWPRPRTATSRSTASRPTRCGRRWAGRRRRN